MIEEIRIRSLGVIDESVLEFGTGLTAITGETGAGKTMVVTALGLLLGARADAGTVRSGAKAARVEGRFSADDKLAVRIDGVGGDLDEGSALVARQVSSEGRSRAFAGGAAVPVGTLAEITDDLVAVHGQSDQHRLLRPDNQLEMLDRAGADELTGPLAEFATGYRELRDTERELAEVVRTSRERAQEADLLRHGLEEIAAVEPLPGEDLALAADEQRLGSADELRSAAEQVRELLSSEQGNADAVGALAEGRRLLDRVRDRDPEAAGLADRLAEAAYLVDDLAADLASYASGIDADPARLAAISSRRAALTALLRKYGDTVDEVLAWSEQSSRRLLDLDGTDDKIDQLRHQRTSLRDRLGKLAVQITEIRTRRAAELAERVTAEVGELAMPHATVTISVTQQPDEKGLPVGDRVLRFGPTGTDDVQILLAANAGAEPRSLAKSASGGELSRVMLALEVALAAGAASTVPTFVFDEVDAGVGGRAAVEIGRRLAILARDAQVIVVTHLPQVAAFADHHVVVAKSTDGLVTTSGLTVLSEEDRTRELARMLAGMDESDTGLAHAQELLGVAREVRGA